MYDKIALDSNAFIAYRQGVDKVCRIVDEASELFVPVTVVGELLFGALNSTPIERPEDTVTVVG